MTKSNKRKQQKKARAPRRRSSPVNQLDPAASNYARLLADPCAAPVVHPVYPGGGAGFLFRADSFFTVGATSGATSGYLHWIPSYPNAGDTNLLAGAGALGTTVIPSVALTTGPGKAFLASNAKGVRCVAACMKVTFPGSESTRSGRVHYGQTNASILDFGDSATADDMATLLQHYTRTPPETIELIWKPDVGDFEFNDPTEPTGAIVRDRKSAMTVAWAGLPTAVGLTFHLTAVFEWTPKGGLGVAGNSTGKAVSRNTFDDVVDYLQNAGFTWVRQAGMAAGAGLMSGISQTFGLIPANRNMRRIGMGQ